MAGVYIRKKAIKGYFSTKGKTKERTRQNAWMPSTPAEWARRDGHQAELSMGSYHARPTVFAHRHPRPWSSSGLRDLTAVEITDQDVRTIEQILFKYSRDRPWPTSIT
ncbi:hypothetical protein MPTK1_7g17150 [Marchantia polymorpha subsp. ruderalis]|uniref:Uncharacterized protein n=2 Tax=Marchantia polymorpha TaxID=3197 RepID=A0AAF6C0P0_MARPO|nr:hypothetical protein MARPO_0051s0052 [Marchantia polymorpha]BBN17824.1 hypothetical protein Mp_7g17150 [Marchantia polymorpha subsp. ruderalis]|eukprot:PTQ38449.1 hypothetical protein MARPO_0051s0052 [Marchantia polymorpha]